MASEPRLKRGLPARPIRIPRATLFLSCAALVSTRLIASLNQIPHAISVGPYRVSALSRQLADGRFTASVSIRSGRGSATTDRILRLDGRFASEHAAQRHAHEQGLIWVRRTGAGCDDAGLGRPPLHDSPAC
jgi:hypothetical protein